MSMARVATWDESAPRSRAASPVELAAHVHLARFLLRPADYIDESRFVVTRLAGPAVAAMNGHHAFRKPLNAALADLLFTPADLADPTLTTLPESRVGRLGALLLVVPMERLRRVAALIAAAVASRQITALILAADRRRAQDTMGDEAFRFAVEEAPMMFAELANGAVSPDIQTNTHYAAHTEAVLLRFVGAAIPAVKPFLQLRFPERAATGSDLSFTLGQVPSVLRLIMRKEPAWSAFIA